MKRSEQRIKARFERYLLKLFQHKEEGGWKGERGTTCRKNEMDWRKYGRIEGRR
jgi:hypothetical protein